MLDKTIFGRRGHHWAERYIHHLKSYQNPCSTIKKFIDTIDSLNLEFSKNWAKYLALFPDFKSSSTSPSSEVLEESEEEFITPLQDTLKDFDFSNFLVPLHKNEATLLIRNQFFNAEGGLQEIYKIDSLNFRRQNVSGDGIK